MGNICRSPVAESVFRKFVHDAELQMQIVVDSAGTHAYHLGSPADSRSRSSAHQRGYEVDSVSRHINQEDSEGYDLIVAMDHNNLHALESLFSGAQEHVRLLGSFIADHDPAHIPDVRDPYYGDGNGFEDVLDMIETACPNILNHCQQLLKR